MKFKWALWKFVAVDFIYGNEREATVMNIKYIYIHVQPAIRLISYHCWKHLQMIFPFFSRFLFQVSLSSLAVDSERFLFFFFIFGIYHSLIVLFLLQIQMVNMSVDNCEHIMRCSKGMIITFDKNRSGSSAVSGGSGCRRTLIFCAVHHQMIISAYVWHEPNKRVK